MSILDFFGARYALKIAVIAASLAAFAVLAAAINGLVGTVQGSLPSWAANGVYFLPPNTGACMSAVITATIARWGYDFQRSRMNMVGNG